VLTAKVIDIHTHTQSFYCSSGICPGLPGWAGTRKVKTRKVKPIWIYWSKRYWVAMASAGPYVSLYLIQDNHANIPPLSFLQAGCPSCCPTNSVKALTFKSANYRAVHYSAKCGLAITSSLHLSICDVGGSW